MNMPVIHRLYSLLMKLSDSDSTRNCSRRQMAYAPSNPMGAPLPLVSGEMDILVTRPAMVATKTRSVPFQVRRQQEQNLKAPKSFSILRRDAMLYMTAEILSGLTFLSAEPAEARVGKIERKKQIMEKLERLREEAGVSKRKTEKGITPPTPRGSVAPVVEAILP